VGAVAYLRNVSSAILAARAVMRFTRHTLLAGDGATALAAQLGGQPAASISGAHDAAEVAGWRGGGCQPNYYVPATALGANTSCGPFEPVPQPSPTPLPPSLHAGAAGGGWRPLAAARAADAPHRRAGWATLENHDTLGLCALDAAGSLAAAVTSNGANHKVPGRVGDAPVIGAGGYASDEAGGCAAATGDGDITQRFLPAFVATENMRNGMAPAAACEDAVRRIMRHVTDFAIGIVCLNARGEWAAAGHGWTFSYCAAAPSTGGEPTCVHVKPLT
jgi:isoaspartyl peptidase/L-asparaginase-like protein (Ntn-hydrolase superfamily)